MLLALMLTLWHQLQTRLELHCAMGVAGTASRQVRGMLTPSKSPWLNKVQEPRREDVLWNWASLKFLQLL